MPSVVSTEITPGVGLVLSGSEVLMRLINDLDAELLRSVKIAEVLSIYKTKENL